MSCDERGRDPVREGQPVRPPRRGPLQIQFAARHPDRVADLVFADTLALSRGWTLACEAFRHPLRLLWMATPRTVRDFAVATARHPFHLLQAAWWGFVNDRQQLADAVREAELDAQVLWASRDSLLSRRAGEALAADLNASFTMVRGRFSMPADHDWLYRHPWLVREHLEELTVWALRA